MEILFLLAVGLLAGFMSGLFGIGGGLIIVPFLVIFKDMSLKLAFGTSMGALLLPVGLLGVMEYYKAGNINLKFALVIAVAMFFGAYFGAKIVQPMSPTLLRKLYGVFLIAAAAKMFFGK